MSKPLFEVKSTISIPKYQQIVDGIIAAVERKAVRRGEVLPSVSQLCKDFSLSRETVVKAYGKLKKQGIIDAVPRKGYYVATEYIKHDLRVFVLFDVFTPYKQVLYYAFKEALGEEVTIDIYFHHFNTDLFESLLLDNMGKYNMYIVMSYPHERMQGILNKLDTAQLLVLDRSHLLILDRCKDLAGPYSFICQNHNETLYECLQNGLPLLQKYQKIVLVFPLPSNHPTVIMDGFSRFCIDHHLRYGIVHSLKHAKIHKKTAYFVIDDPDLVQIVERCKANNYTLGKDVGVLSYNETDMKRVVSDGITVVSANFAEMGRKAAGYVRNPTKVQEIVPTELIVRNSL